MAAIFMSLFAIAPTPVKAVTCYTDAWFVNDTVTETDPETGETMYPESAPAPLGYTVGSGVTQMPYYAPYHDAWVDTTITSPNGRTITVTGFDDAGGYKQSFNAHAETTLAFDWDDVGNYTVTSDHYSDCPLTNFGSTSLGISYEVVQDHYSLSAVGYFSCRYAPTCIGQCSKFPYRRKLVFPGSGCEPFLQCSSVLVHVRGSSFCTTGKCIGAGPTGTCS